MLFFHSWLRLLRAKVHQCHTQNFTPPVVLRVARTSRFLAIQGLPVLHTLGNCTQRLLVIGKIESCGFKVPRCRSRQSSLTQRLSALWLSNITQTPKRPFLPVPGGFLCPPPLRLVVPSPQASTQSYAMRNSVQVLPKKAYCVLLPLWSSVFS